MARRWAGYVGAGGKRIFKFVEGEEGEEGVRKGEEGGEGEEGEHR